MNAFPKGLHAALRTSTAGLTLALSAASAYAALPEVKVAKVNGIDIRYVEQGSGALLILLHGALGNYDGFQEQMPLLAKDFRVVSYSQRHYGTNDSDPSSAPLSLEQQADDLAGLIKTLGGRPAHLVGVSMGGWVAHQATLRHPELVRSAYLYEGMMPLVVDKETAAADGAYYGPMFAPMVEHLKKNEVHAAARALMSAVSGDPGYYDKVPAHVQEGYKRNEPGFVKWIARKPVAPIECAEMAKNTVPVILVVGTATAFKPMLDGRYERCLGARSTTEKVDGATHQWPRDDPQAFAKSVRTFASRH